MRKKEIPPFSLPVRLDEGNEKLEMDILEEIVQQNYIKIINDVNEVLKGVEEKIKKRNNLDTTHNQRQERNFN